MALRFRKCKVIARSAGWGMRLALRAVPAGGRQNPIVGGIGNHLSSCLGEQHVGRAGAIQDRRNRTPTGREVPGHEHHKIDGLTSFLFQWRQEVPAAWGYALER